jgi:hypothetical protein
MKPSTLNKITTHKIFKKDIKALNWYFRQNHKLFLKINNNRLSLTHEYVCNLLLTIEKWNSKLLKNKYFMFILNADNFKCFLEEEYSLKDVELGKYFMSFIRLTDKFLMSHILFNKITKNTINEINLDLNKWFKFSYTFSDKLFKDYCFFVKYLTKLNKTKGSIKSENDFTSALAKKTIKHTRASMPKHLQEPSLDWF